MIGTSLQQRSAISVRVARPGVPMGCNECPRGRSPLHRRKRWPGALQRPGEPLKANRDEARYPRAGRDLRQPPPVTADAATSA
jgi:hypothetical protein